MDDDSITGDIMRVLTFLLLGLFALAGCTNPNDLDKAPAYLGNFNFGHNVVVAPNLVKGPASREATREDWIEAMKTAMADRFDRYEGDKLYHLGISIEGYVLAIPGIPIVADPNSALIINLTVWDDAAEKKLTEKPEQITVLETISGSTLISSGLFQSPEKQMENLSKNAAKQIQNWLQRMNNEHGWFEDDGVPFNKKRNILGLPKETADTDDAAPADTDATSDSAEAIANDTEEVLTAPVNDADAILDNPVVEPQLEG